jgi:hypothetical protein
LQLFGKDQISSIHNQAFATGEDKRKNIMHKNNNPDSVNQGRKLIYIPVLHTQDDMGSFSELIREATLKKHGKKLWDQKVGLINEIWEEINRKVTGLDLKHEKVRLYQDGLPVCDRELEIVTEIAKTGSLNHQLLIRLLERGAILMGTESAELLVEEYKLVKKILAAGNIEEAGKIEASQKALSDNLLKKRDQYIAERINNTLGAGETGILFLGMLHSLEKLLNNDILVTYPLFKPYNMMTEGEPRYIEK